jgi:transposase
VEPERSSGDQPQLGVHLLDPCVPRNLTERQQLKLARVQALNQRLYRAYLLSQELRKIYRVPFQDAIVLLDAWLAWARRSGLQPFIKLARTIIEPVSWSTTTVRYRCPLRIEISSTQIRWRPANRTRVAVASSVTRVQIQPTVRHATRINCATAVFDAWTVSHAT